VLPSSSERTPRPAHSPRPDSPAWLVRLCTEFCALVVPGRIWPMPGTWGSLLAVVLAPFLFLPMAWGGRALVLLAVFCVGGYAATRVERSLNRKDPGIVVIDELVGQWFVFFPFAQVSFWELGAGLALFRIFDVVKPPPVRSSETWLPEGYGIMIDDVLAGAYAMACLWLLRSFVF